MAASWRFFFAQITVQYLLLNYCTVIFSPRPTQAAKEKPVQITTARSYRCSYHPKDLNGYPVAAESGVQPFVQLKANSAEHAARAAHAVTGCPVSEVVRVEGGAA